MKRFCSSSMTNIGKLGISVSVVHEHVKYMKISVSVVSKKLNETIQFAVGDITQLPIHVGVIVNATNEELCPSKHGVYFILSSIAVNFLRGWRRHGSS